MAYKVLYRKYRPEDFNSLYGQDNIKKILTEEIINDKISHAYIFSGPRGTGKTSAAKIMAKTLNCKAPIDGNACGNCIYCKTINENPDIIEIDAASNNGVEEIRNLRDNIKILPTQSKYKVYIIDEVHMLSQSAWNAFLKTLEEPPQHVIFILATTEVQKIPVTVLSRCQRFTFNRISSACIKENLNRIAKVEKIKITNEALDYISVLAEGGMRDALSILDQISTIADKITIDEVQKFYNIVDKTDIVCLFKYLRESNVNEIIKIFEKFSFQGINNNVLIDNIINYLYEEEIRLLNSDTTTKEISTIKQMVIDVAGCYNKSDIPNLLKVIMLTYLSSLGNKVDSKIISREIISNIDVKQEEKKNHQSNDTISENLIVCRINNAFYEASKERKLELKKNWKEFVNLIRTKELELLSAVEDASIEVVSKTNIIFSINSSSTALLFNSKAKELEKEFNKLFKSNYKFICLDELRWRNEKENYIRNSKKENYSYMNEEEFVKENTEIEDSNMLNCLAGIFDKDTIEIE